MTPEQIQTEIDESELVSFRLDELIPRESNPRKNREAAKRLAKTVRKWGWGAPPLVQKSTGRLIAGHTRLKAASAIGLERLTCYVLDVDDRRAQALSLADNRLGEFASWDDPLLAEELSAFSLEEADELGFDRDYLEQLGAKLDEREVEQDEVPSVPKEPTSRLGDIYTFEDVGVLIVGDCREEGVLERAFAELKLPAAELLLTDPPYNVDLGDETVAEAKRRNRRTDGKKVANDKMGDEDFREFLRSSLARAFATMARGGSFYIWHATAEVYNFVGALRDLDEAMRQILVWDKGSIIMGRQDYQWAHEPCLYGWKKGAGHRWRSDRRQSTVLRFDKPSRNPDHPTMKPTELFAYLIKNSSLPGDVVLDPFAGSGTTLVCAAELDRRAVVCELDPGYADVIVERWAKRFNSEPKLAHREES